MFGHPLDRFPGAGGSGDSRCPIGVGTDDGARESGDDHVAMSQRDEANIGSFGLSEQRLRDDLEDELLRRMKVEGGVPTVHASRRAWRASSRKTTFGWQTSSEPRA